MPVSLPFDDPLIGTTVVGRYRIVQVLSEGGMGRVYVAEHTAIQKRVAFKVLREEFSGRGDIVTRFQQEAISASRIKHPNVLEIFDFGRLESGATFLVMELLEGRDLANELRRTKTIDLVTGMRIAFQMCNALAAAHRRGVVHRDMKPANVFLQTSESGVTVKIVDFGVAQLRDDGERSGLDTERLRITKAGTILGTPEYMAPEQGAGRRADHRADIYAVGVILYEMFTGQAPFRAPTAVETLAKHQTEPPPPMPSALSRELRAAIARALAKNPAKRFQRMSELERALAATPEGAAATRKVPRSRSFMPVPTPANLVGADDRPSIPESDAKRPLTGTAALKSPTVKRRLAPAALGVAAALVLAAFLVKAMRGGQAIATPHPAKTPAHSGSSEPQRLSVAAATAASVPIESGLRLCDVEVDGVWHGPCERADRNKPAAR